jgi:hypothetical protein
LTDLDLDMTKIYSQFSCDTCADQLFYCQYQNELFKQKKPKVIEVAEPMAEIMCMQSNCGKMFASSKYLRTHFELVHKLQRTVKCPYCVSMYHEKNECNIHIDRKHKKIRFACEAPGCNKQLSNRNSLKYHIWYKHRKTDFHNLLRKAALAEVPEGCKPFKHVWSIIAVLFFIDFSF